MPGTKKEAELRRRIDALRRRVAELEEALHESERRAEERHGAGDALACREAELRATLYSIGDAVISTDIDGRVVRMNPVAEQLTGWTEVEVAGKPLEEVFHIVNEETQREAENPVARVLREGVVVGLANHTLLIARDGREVAIADAGAPIMGDKGEIVGVVLVFRDQTEERRLQKSQRLLASIVESSFDAIIGKTLDGTIVSWNAAAERIFGYTAKEMVGQSILKMVPPDQAGEVSQWLEKIRRGKRLETLDTMRRRKDGRLVHVALTISPIVDDVGKVIGASTIARDQTERRQAEDELRSERDKFDGILASLGAGLDIVDTGFRVGFQNQFLRDRFGDLTGKICYEEYMGRQEPCEGCPMKKAIATGSTQMLELSAPDGREYEVVSTPFRDIDGEIKAVEVVRDITERKRAEEALRRSHRELEVRDKIARVFLSAPDEEMYSKALQVILEAMESEHGVFGYIGEDGALVCPSMTTEIWDQCQVPDKDIVFPRETWGGIWGRALIEKKARFSNESLSVPEGHVPIVRALDVPIIHQGEVVGNVLVGNKATDYDENDKRLLETITHYIAPVLAARLARDREERRRKRLEAQFLQAQKLESVGRLAGGVAHDYNNMLSVILGYSELAVAKVEPSEPLHSDLQEIRKAAKRSMEVTRQLLAFARKQTIAPKALDLNDAVEGMLKMLRHLIGEDIDLAWRPEAGLWPVRMDPSQLDQILANLCVNARDAIVGVGKITIETGNVALDEAYCAEHAGVVPGEFVLLAVSDDGHGMAQETLDMLFEPFFTTKEMGKGTGLGLATVYGIVKQNNGYIQVYSEMDKGTTFKVYLPRHAGQIVEDRNTGHTPSPRGRGETVLVVEDEASILRLAERTLDALGYRVLTAKTPAEAMELAGKHGGEISLLMTDVVLPEMSGRDLAERLLSSCPNLKSLYMSGYAANVIAHRGVLEEAVNFIQKPFSTGGLATKVRETLDSE